MTRLQELYSIYGQLVWQLEVVQNQVQQLKRDILQEIQRPAATGQAPNEEERKLEVVK